MTERLPEITSYSDADLKAKAAWPAIERYRGLVERKPTTPENVLRLARQKEWLRCALATAFDSASAADVCRYWSDAADRLILEAWKQSGCEAYGYALLAMGKLGSRELNLSSDVDLVIVRGDRAEPDPKALRAFQSLLSELTEFGFCLRVDLTLRPGGYAATVLPTLGEFENHYGYHGEMWERLAYVRMRVLAGDASLVDAITTFTRKFSFRKHLDFTLLDELKGLRTKIRQEKYESRAGVFHLKLGEGGIRELELFVHALQVIHGGRHASLRTSSTTEALERIRELALLPKEDCDFLLEAYWYLRTLENKLHAYDDQQNYLVDVNTGHPALPEDFPEKLKTTCSRIKAIATSLFGETNVDAIPAATTDQSDWLEGLGFSKASVYETWPELLGSTAVSRKSQRDEEARLAFLKGFVETLAREGLDRDLGLSLLLDFVKAIRAKASFFTSLNRETRVRDDLARLFSISPYLGNILVSRPELIDEFILRRRPEPSQDLDLLLEELAERRLLAELIAANQFLSDLDLKNLCSNLTSNADSIASLLLSRLKDEYGPSDVELIAMGKWGGRELGLRSDLDFVFVVPGEPSANDQKVAKRFLARMTEPHRGGAIYAIDMRLRPSGQAGPILVSAPRLKSYLEGTEPAEAAAAWERQAYLRSRPLVKLAFDPGRTGAKRALSETDVAELRMIRSKLFSPMKTGEIDLKLTDGGLADIEFTAQIALLSRGGEEEAIAIDPSTSGMIQYLEGVDATWSAIGEGLRDHYDFLRRTEQLFQLTTSQSGSKMRVKSDEFRRLALVMKSEPIELESKLRHVFDDVSSLLSKVRRT
ncbi:MAG: glutamine-synthetase adenylyltransferase [Bdellovibrionota bacterium]